MMVGKRNNRQETHLSDLVNVTRLIHETSLKERMITLLTKWEVILGLLLILVFVYFSNITPYFLDEIGRAHV